MNFQQFAKRMKETICDGQISEETVCCGHNVIETIDGKVYVDFKETELANIEEAIDYINRIVLEEELIQDLYNDMPDVTVASIIKEHHDVKVTDALIESYIELASSKDFSVDPVVSDIRKHNLFDSLFEDKLDYKLKDGSIMALSEETQQTLNNLLKDKPEIVDYMKESKTNFMHIIRELS